MKINMSVYAKPSSAPRFTSEKIWEKLSFKEFVDASSTYVSKSEDMLSSVKVPRKLLMSGFSFIQLVLNKLLSYQVVFITLTIVLSDLN